MTRRCWRAGAGVLALAAVLTGTAACSGVPAISHPSGAVTQPTSGPYPGDADPRPDRATVITGLTAFYEREGKLPPDKAPRFATCLVDTMYDQASTRTLRALRDGNPKDLEPLDTGLIAKAGLDCQSVLT